jgi:phospholipid/cholesterol/gamma-HCH transport system substrate-binding protein
MTERQMQVRIGALVLVGILIFFAFVLSIGKRSALFEERYSLWTSFSSSEGLAVGSPVRLAGVTVGNVTHISFGRDPRDRRIVVTLTAERRVQERIRTDSLASIGTIGLVGDKVLDITVGSHDRPALPPGGQLASTDPPDYTRLLQKGDRILDHMTHVSASLEEFLGGGEQTGKKSLSEGLRSLRNTLVQVEKGEGLLHDLVYGRDGRELLGRADRALQSMERVAKAIETERGLLHALVYSPPEETLGRFTRSADSVTRLAEGAEALLKEARDGKGLLHALLYDPEGAEILVRLGRSSERMEELVRAIREGQGLVPALLFDPERARLLDDVQATAAGLKTVTTDLAAIAARLREGEGTVGGLLEDPTIYEDLSALLRGANRSTLLRSLIRSTRDSGAQTAP